MENSWLIVLLYICLICPFLVLCQQVGEACREPDMLCDIKAGLHCSPKPRGVCQECGLNNRQNFNDIRIIGGKPTDPKAWPWMAGITKEAIRHFPICGGTLITDRHVLTAAHCIIHFLPKDLIVRLGEHDFSSKGDNSPMDFEIGEIEIHEKYDIETIDNDIALLTLRNGVKFNEFIWPACLPPLNLNFVNQVGLVAGWGTKSFEGPTNSVLHEAHVKIWPQEDCTKAYTDRVITDNMICCGWESGKVDSCHGDSGGPFMMQMAGSRRWILIGIVSWGRGCARPDQPGVYTKVANYLNWIEVHTKQIGDYVNKPQYTLEVSRNALTCKGPEIFNILNDNVKYSRTNVVAKKRSSLMAVCKDGYEYLKEVDWCIKASATSRSWNAATVSCAAEGGTLAIVDTKEKHGALSDMMRTKNIDGVWIGLSASLNEGKYVWIDGTPATFTSWGKGQPDDAGNNEDCVHFSAGWDYKWNDESCDKIFKYLCEKRIKKTAACPQDYIYFRETDWCVKPSTRSRSWDKVPEACAAEGGTFAVVNTARKHEAISNMMRTQDISGLWIGLNAKLEKWKFAWIDGTPVSFTSWGNGQPDGAGNDEDCVHFSAGWGYKWNDESCGKHFQFLCEKKRI